MGQQLLSIACAIAQQIYYFIMKCIFPPLCNACGDHMRERMLLCGLCVASIEPVVPVRIQITQKYSADIFAVGVYKGALKQLILGKSHRDRLSAITAGILLAQESFWQQRTIDYLIPVPLHWTRIMHRGYNQSLVIAEEIARVHKYLILDVCRRVKRTAFQSQVTADERAQNVHEAFELQSHAYELIKGKHVVIVDDLYTTGATIKELAHVVKMGKPASITIVVISRTIK